MGKGISYSVEQTLVTAGMKAHKRSAKEASFLSDLKHFIIYCLKLFKHGSLFNYLQLFFKGPCSIYKGVEYLIIYKLTKYRNMLKLGDIRQPDFTPCVLFIHHSS